MPHYCYRSGLQHSEIDLADLFGTRVIAYQYPNSYAVALHWLPYSPDLNPCDFFLWGHIKDLANKKKPTELISLKRSITDSFAGIKRKNRENATDNFVTRLRYCITSDGSHFENVLH
ncbi:hypothetical protein AVEN_93846-1 [Araneus ventricosus]|uniref:Tc1-like transposase DDE domain-containing protein n=1 Tax=Araneus ventricosus TaxID=182803 RepID=A0A4Y2B181_ARAVE|nr:hypothetical protein AVEN_93846-1 [Araneus ventricosus]